MATVIRAGELPTITKRPSTIDLSDHIEEARRVVEEARREARRILDKAQAEVEKVHAETRESGYEQGFEAGKREGRESGFAAAHREASEEFEREHVDLVAGMRRVVDEIDGMKSDLQLAANARLLRFAVQLAQKLTFDIGARHTEAAQANLQRAIDVLGTKLNVTVRAHPQDVGALRTFAAGVADHVAQSPSIRLEEDENVAPGGCVVCGDACEIDASLETQAAELSALLLGEESAGRETVNRRDTKSAGDV